MTLEKITVNGKPRYILQEVTKGRSFGTVVYFDNLASAAIVLRYLKGANMPQADQATALRLILEWDGREDIAKEPAAK